MNIVAKIVKEESDCEWRKLSDQWIAMEKYLRENFSVQPKNPSEAALRRWRSAVSVVKNPRRRFRMVANLAQRAEAEHKRKKLQVLIRLFCFPFQYLIFVNPLVLSFRFRIK